MNTIIVADDDLMTRTLIKRYLENLGFDVLLEASGDHVLQLAMEHQPVACVIDLFMEGKEGIETIRELETLPHKPKLIAISSNETYLDMTLQLGADAHIIKPITQKLLQDTLEMLGIEVNGAGKNG